MIKFLAQWKEERQKKTEALLNYKILELRHYITKFFEDLQTTKETVEIPAWVECKNLMKKLNIDIKHPKIVNFYYRHLQMYKLKNSI